MAKAATYTARTDFSIIPISSVPRLPAIGHIAIDPDFQTHILRVTGPGFNPELPDFAYGAGVGGSADVNVWNKNSTKFCFEDQSNRVYVMGFAPLKMQTIPLWPKIFKQGTLCFQGGGRCEFAKFGDILFRYDGLRIWEYVFGNAVAAIPPAPILICDFSKALGPMFIEKWMSIGGASADAKTFACAYSDTGGQGSGTTIMVWHVGRGWRRFETETGQVTGQWGPTGTIKSTDRFTIHNVKLSPGGKYLVIATAQVDDGTVKNKHFWNIETLEMSVVSEFTDGHFTQGYTSWINNGGIPFGQWQKRLFTEPDDPQPLVSPMPDRHIVPVWGTHPSWNNVGPTDKEPFFATSVCPNET